MEIEDMFEQIRTEGAEELRNAISIIIEEAIDTSWPAYTKEEKLETKWFLEGLRYALLIVNYTPIRGEHWDGE